MKPTTLNLSRRNDLLWKKRRANGLPKSVGSFLVNRCMADSQSALALACANEAHERIMWIVDTLPTILREIICIRFGLRGFGPTTLEECGRACGIAGRLIWHREKRALKLLRCTARSKALKPFFDEL